MPTEKPKIFTGMNVGWFMELHHRLLRGEITMAWYEHELKKEREARRVKSSQR